MKRIFEILHFYRMPWPLLRSVWTYYIKKLLRYKMDGTYGEWVYILYKCAIKCRGRVSMGEQNLIRLTLKDGTNLLIRNFPSSDAKVLLQVWGVQEYKGLTDKISSIKTAITPTRIIDAGANTGYTTVYLKKKFPDATIVSIEPAASNLEMLRNNISINSLTSIVVEEAALWHKSANLQIVESEVNGNEWAFSVKEVKHGGIKSVCFDDIMEKMKWEEIDIVKMDIEGSEQYLFQEADDSFWLDKVKAIAIEIHPIKGLRERIVKAMLSKGFEIFESGELTIGVRA